MPRKKTGSSPTSRRNRQTARSIKDDKGKQLFKGTKEARDAGLSLPTKQEIEDQENDASKPRIPVYKPKR